MRKTCPSRTLDDAARMVRRLDRRSRAGLEWHYGLFESGRGVLIGAVGVVPLAAEPDAAELGYWLRDGWTGHGFATEAIAEVVNHTRTCGVLHRLEIRAPVDNRRSLAIPPRLGFVRTPPAGAPIECWVLRW